MRIIQPATAISMVLVQVIGLLIFTWCLWKVFRHRFLPSSLDNIPGPAPTSFWTGIVAQVFANDAWDFHEHLFDNYAHTIRFTGVLGEKELYTYDPLALHHIFVKDQHVFEETDHFIHQNTLLFGPGLLSTLGDQHRKQRKMLNPVFSTTHLRDMVPLFYNITHKLREAILIKVKDGAQEVEMLSWLSRTALELIAQSGMGHSFDALVADMPTHPYIKASKALVPTLFKPGMIVALSFVLPRVIGIGPPAFRRWVVDHIPWSAMHELRDITDVLHDTSVEVFDAKMKALSAGDEELSSKIGEGKDIMSILIRANMHASKEECLTREELTGQMTTLIFAGTDTTTSAVSRILHLLSIHQDVQAKLRTEIREATEVEGSDLPYDTIMSLPYLDAICRETLRLYPPIPLPRRVARADIVLPFMTPMKGLNGHEIHEIIVQKGTKITTGIIASNINQALWGPDSKEWKPERWLSPLPEELTSARIPGIYSNIMTFIGGSRACIGFKFSQLEMKIILSILIQTFYFQPSTKAEIAWQMNSIVSPSVVGEDPTVSQLPLIIERV